MTCQCINMYIIILQVIINVYHNFAANLDTFIYHFVHDFMQRMQQQIIKIRAISRRNVQLKQLAIMP